MVANTRIVTLQAMPPGTQIDTNHLFSIPENGWFLRLLRPPAPSPVRTVIVLGNTENSVAARLQIAVVGLKENRRPGGRRFVLCMRFWVQSSSSSNCASSISTWVPAKLSKSASWDFLASSFCSSASGRTS